MQKPSRDQRSREGGFHPKTQDGISIMDYSLTADYDDYHCIDCEEELERLAPEEPAPPPKRQCGQCEHYQQPRTFSNGTKAWGYCKLRAAADVHPCNLPPWDTHANQCHFYSEDCPF
jgi:hypothetical protein